MIFLSSNTDSLELVLGGAVTSSELSWVACYTDYEDATGITDLLPATGLSNGPSAVTLVSGPSSGHRVVLDYLSVCNRDVADADVTIRFNQGSTYEIVTQTLTPGQTLQYTRNDGWSIACVSGGGGSGTVTSVGLSTDAAWFTVGSSPVTSSGTITLNATTGLTANQVLATPDGMTGVVGLRSLTTADISDLDLSDYWYLPGVSGSVIAFGSVDADEGLSIIGSQATGGFLLLQGSAVPGESDGIVIQQHDFLEVIDGNAPSNPSSGRIRVYASSSGIYAKHSSGTTVRVDSGGTVTSVSAGTGLTGGPIVTSGSLAVSYGSSAGTACQGNDSRLSDARTPTAHATSHQNGGSDEIATATAAANAIPKAGAGGTLASGWIPTIDHGSGLTGLTTGDDHTQYALLAGRASSQTLKGGTGSGETLTLSSTNHATKGGVLLGSGDWLRIPEISAPSTPAASTSVIYAKSDGKVYSKNSAGTEYDLTGSSLDITGLTANDIDVADELPNYDSSATANRKITVKRLLGYGLRDICQCRLSLADIPPDYPELQRYYPSAYSRVPDTTDTSAETVAMGHDGWATGTIVTPSATGGGLTAGTTYWVGRISTGVYAFYTSLANAIADTSRVNLTATITATIIAFGIQGKTLYLNPLDGGWISLYDGTRWNVFNLSASVSLALSSLTSGANYDVFIYDNSGTPTLELFAWSTDTVRTTLLAIQDGILVKASAATRRYLGTLRTIATDATEISNAKSFVWNYYNQLPYSYFRNDTTDSWTDAGNGTWSAINGGSAVWKFEFVTGVTDKPITARAVVSCNSNYIIAIAMDSTSAYTRETCIVCTDNGGASVNPAITFYDSTPSIGYHYLQVLESTAVAGTKTAYGDNGGVAYANSGWIVEGWR